MKKVIISALTILATGCTTLTDKIVKPSINEDNYWNTPCFVSGVTLKKPWLKKEKYGYDQ
jgi:hypothetical protein